METWREIATGLFVLGGLVLVLVAMAQARDRKGGAKGDVLRAGLIALVVLGVLTLVIATVATKTIAWALVAAVGMIVGTVLFIDA
ncbi:hypothetical protein D5S17_23725 [Pseudonocardiaceae bacterium YIM PH 21723]|nr:hypothetical protein D5S17_23725 [Pseudonocardiaceae bacterium YIM PH 21723]